MCLCVCVHVCMLHVSVINRCIPAVFNKIVDMTEEIKTADAKYTITTLFNDTITGSKLENGTQYVLIYIYILCLCLFILIYLYENHDCFCYQIPVHCLI